MHLSNEHIERIKELKQQAFEEDMDIDWETFRLVPHTVPTIEQVRRDNWCLIDRDDARHDLFEKEADR